MIQTVSKSHKRTVTAVAVMLMIMLLATIAPVAPAGAADCAWTHLVRPGDTLGTIASYYGTTVSDLAKLNNIANPNLIYWGTTLCISENVPPPGPYPVTYTIHYGDTLAYLSWRLGVTIGELALHNGIGNPNLIFAGETITIPQAIPTVPYYPPPTATTAPPTIEPTEEPTVTDVPTETETPVDQDPTDVPTESTAEAAG